MINIKKVRPLFTRLITTARVYSMDELQGIVIDPMKVQGSLKEYQEVLAVGDSVRGINVGDLVKIDPTNYSVKKYKEGTLKDGVVTSNPVIEYRFNTLEIDGKQCLLIQDRDVEYVIEDWEEKEDSGIINTQKSIIL